MTNQSASIPPGADPAYPPYGRGDGSSPAATGTAAFDVPPERQIDVLTGDDYTRRQRRTNRQELGFTPDAQAGYPDLDTGTAASVDPQTLAAADRFAGDPNSNYGVTPPDDARTAAPTVRQ